MARHKGENPYIYGLHDRGGEHLLVANGEAKGWVLVSEVIGADAGNLGGGDYRELAAKGLGVMVRLTHASGANGTLPRPEHYPEFARRCANFVQASQGAGIWLIGNEMNAEREQPRQKDSQQAEPITPRRYAQCYQMVRQKIKALPGHQDDLVIVGAVSPWNAQTAYEADPEGKYPANKIPGAPRDYPYFGFFGDFIIYWRDLLAAIGAENCDGMAIHAYSHGYSPDLVFCDDVMDSPFQDYHYHFRIYRDFLNAVPPTMRHLPVYLTEANGDREGPGGPTWPFGNNGWIKSAYQEIDRWNQTGQQQIRCLILYRWQKDPLGWAIDGKPAVQQDFLDAIAKNYRWNAAAPEQPAPTASPVVPLYRVKYLSHTTPAGATTGQTINVTLNLQNEGSFTWSRNSDKPCRLGFQWYDAGGRYIPLPADLDFRTELPQDVAPGGQAQVQARLRTPEFPGNYQLRWDMVHEQVAWFSGKGDLGLVVPVAVTPANPLTAADASVRTTAPGAPVTIEAEDISGSLPHQPDKSYSMRLHADIKRLIVHHTATAANVSVARIADFQVNQRGLPGIAYHFCITAAGKVYQTQSLETVSLHAGTYSADSAGVCLIGNFTSAAPSSAQINAAAALLAQLCIHLGLSAAQIFGYSDLVVTGSPGTTWPAWKKPLLRQVDQWLNSGQPITVPPPQPAKLKTIDHYLLLWYRSPEDWATWDLQGAMGYIARFKPTIGFDIEQAKQATYVTILGGTGGVPANAERILRAAGCQVERIGGPTEAETRRLLQQLTATGQRFKTLG